MIGETDDLLIEQDGTDAAGTGATDVVVPGVGGDQESESRFQKRINSLTGQKTAAEQAASRERQLREDAERRAAAAEQRAKLAEEAGQTYATRNVDQAEKAAKAALRQAIADGDAEAQVEAADALAEAKAHRVAMATQQPRQQEQQTEQPRQQQASPAAQAWLAANPWMQDQAKAAQAVQVHHDLVSDGITADSRAYWRELTARTRGLAKADADLDDEPAPMRRAAAGSGVTRTTGPSAGNETRVRLTADQQAAAQMLGISNQDYAADLQRLRRDGRIKS
jgi:hypothetical protein